MTMTGLLSWFQDHALTEQLISISIKAILVLAVAAGLSFALRHASAAARHFVWTVAIAGVLALPMLSISLPVWRIAVLSSPEPTPDPHATNPNQIVAVSTITDPYSVVPSTGNPPTAAASLSTQFPIDSQTELSDTSAPLRPKWIGWALMLWLAGSFLILGRLLIGTANIWWIADRAEKVIDTRWLNAANDIAWQIGLMRPVQLLKTPRLSMPVTCGLINAAILLPSDADRWPLERRQVVLIHELAHVKRRDCLTQLFAQIACSLYWFNPLVWLASRQLRIERERACDDQVIHIGTKASDYAGHLLEMARTFRSTKCSSLAAVAIARRSELEGRLLAILDPDLKRRGLPRSAAVFVGTLIVLMVFPLATIRLTAKAHQQSAIALETASDTPTRLEYAAGVPMQSQVNNPSAQAVVAAHLSLDKIEPAADADRAANQEAPTAANTQTANTQAEKRTAIESLREALKDEDAEVRQQALFALTQIGDPEAATTLVAALKDQNWQVRMKAAWGLGLHGSSQGTDALIGALRDPEARVREQAAWALGLKGDSRCIDPLIAALRDENADVREKAAWALGLKGDRRSVEPLMALLRDPSPKIRGMAAWALGLKGDTRAASELKDLLKDTNTEVRKKAAWALGMLLMKSAGSFSGDRDSDKDNESNNDARSLRVVSDVVVRPQVREEVRIKTRQK